MTKNDFDIDFDFDEEYGFDPKTLLGDETYDDNIDLDAFSDEELGLKEPVQEEVEEPSEESYTEEEAADEELPYAPLEGFPREEPEQAEELEEYVEEDYSEEAYAEEEYPQEQAYDEELPEDDDEEDEEIEDRKKQKKAKKPRKKVSVPKVHFHTPKLLTKFYDVYFAPLKDKSLLEEPQDPNNPRRRRRKSRSQVFKEVYLPPILVCLCGVLVLSFLTGSITNAVAQYDADKAAQQSRLDKEQDAAELAEQELSRVMQEAERLAAGYNYDEAIKALETYSDPSSEQIAAKRAEYVTAKNSLIEYNDPSMIPNLSFHVLIHDLPRALKDEKLGGNYNKNFVSTQEFTNILSQLYNNGYVLVDFDSFIKSNADVDGNAMYFPDPIYLPAGKKPIMLTETMVNYFSYMISEKEDGTADATGDGFASKLVVQNGDIKAEYVDSDGSTKVGNYDFVPILEDFIEEHPDFSYQGARATLAVCGYDGIFGYRINTGLIASKGNAYHEEQVAGAKEVVQALRDKGYRIACYTYKNSTYKNLTATQIQAEMQDWATQVTPVLGPVDTFVFARSSDLVNYNDTSFDVLYTSGFRYFIATGEEPWAEVNSTFVRQKRLQVSGNTMQWHTKQFTGIFDCAAILDVNNRGNVPND